MWICNLVGTESAWVESWGKQYQIIWGTEEASVCTGVYTHDQKYGQMLFNVTFKIAFRKC